MMEFRFEAGELDEFFLAEHGYRLVEAVQRPDVYSGAHAACQVAEWDCLGTNGLAPDDVRWRLAAFFSCSIIVEATLREDAIRRALARVHPGIVQISESALMPSYAECVYRLARIRLLHVQCNPPSPAKPCAPVDCAALLKSNFRVRNGFHGSDYPKGWIQIVQAALLREADIAGEQLAGQISDDVPCMVTLTQMAAIVSKSKKTLERFYAEGGLPAPIVEGGNGVANEWRWSEVRAPLSAKYGRELPERFPADRFVAR